MAARRASDADVVRVGDVPQVRRVQLARASHDGDDVVRPHAPAEVGRDLAVAERGGGGEERVAMQDEQGGARVQQERVPSSQLGGAGQRGRRVVGRRVVVFSVVVVVFRVVVGGGWRLDRRPGAPRLRERHPAARGRRRRQRAPQHFQRVQRVVQRELAFQFEQQPPVAEVVPAVEPRPARLRCAPRQVGVQLGVVVPHDGRQVAQLHADRRVAPPTEIARPPP